LSGPRRPATGQQGVAAVYGPGQHPGPTAKKVQPFHPHPDGEILQRFGNRGHRTRPEIAGSGQRQMRPVGRVPVLSQRAMPALDLPARSTPRLVTDRTRQA
jgi:hypothetical protein